MISIGRTITLETSEDGPMSVVVTKFSTPMDPSPGYALQPTAEASEVHRATCEARRKKKLEG